MPLLYTVLAFIAGFALGLATALVLKIFQAKSVNKIAKEIFERSEEEKQRQLENIMSELKASFGSLSLDALNKSTDEFLKLAKSRLDSERQLASRELEAKKDLIETQLKRMAHELENVSTLVKELEKDRAAKFGQLASQLQASQEQTSALLKTTNALREALASTKARGQWGERMAEDVLRIAGFLEDVNYVKQKAVKGIGTRPDFTFLLPKGLKLNMDVKFPLDNYLKYLEAGSNMEKAKFKNDFLKDVRARIKEITTRDYINPEQNTLDYVLLFIPNEQIYAFIHQEDPTILDNSIKAGVVLCSPLTLFAVLAVIRQAVDNFALEQRSTEILLLLGQFKKQWEAFVKKLELVGKRIEDARKEFDVLMTTRRRQLERPLNRIEQVRTEKTLPKSLDHGQNKGNGQ